MFSFKHATPRKTQAYIVRVGQHTFYISYETVVAYTGPEHADGVRRKNLWGPTTGRHMREMNVDCMKVLPDLDFQKIIDGVT